MQLITAVLNGICEIFMELRAAAVAVKRKAVCF